MRGAGPQPPVVGTTEWVHQFPDAVRLRSGDDPNDPQAPHIDVAIDWFSRPVLDFTVALLDDQPPTEVFVVYLKSKLTTRLFDASVAGQGHRPHRTQPGQADIRAR